MFKLIPVLVIGIILVQQLEYVIVDSMRSAGNLYLRQALKANAEMKLEKSFRVLVYPDEIPDEIRRDYLPNFNSMMKVVLINTTDSVINIEAQDASLIMIQEALDKDGIWKPVEYWVNSDCGNSYGFSLTLNPGEYSIAATARYKGNFKTKLRLKIKNGLYSQPFEGSINPAQFIKPTFKDKAQAVFINYLED